MRRLRYLILAVILIGALVAKIGPTVQGAGSDAIVPQVVDTDPARGDLLSLDSTLTFYFNTDMDRASVEAAFDAKAVKPATKIDGTFSWQSDAILKFKPTSPLTRATDYTFSFGSNAKSAAGMPIKDGLTLHARTVGYLTVSQVIPKNGTEKVDANAVITVIFNQPVVPLLPVEQMGTLPNPLQFSPDIPGKGEWLNTSIYQFKPSQALAGGTNYTITIKAGLTDITGDTLKDDVISTFSTLSPRVLDLQVQNSQDYYYSPNGYLRDPKIHVSFSRAMEHKSTEAAFTLTGPDHKNQDGTFVWTGDDYAFDFTPKNLLDYSTGYTALVQKNQARSLTGAVLQDDAKTDFVTIAKPVITRTEPGNGETSPFTGFTIDFSIPMKKLTDFKSHVTIDPKPPAFDAYIEDSQMSYGMPFGTEDNTPYTITIDPAGVTDIYGTPLQIDKQSQIYTVLTDGKLQIKYRTHFNYPSEASLQTGTNIGLYSAYNTSTRVYSTHRNIGQVQLDLWKLPLTDLINIYSGNSKPTFYDYVPSNKNFLRTWHVYVDNPTNILRYDLLNISASGPSDNLSDSITCKGAPPTQIRIGMDVTVLSDDPRPLTVRGSAALKANALGAFKPGDSMTVIDGPVCADQFVWWKVSGQTPDSATPAADGSYPAGLTGWVAEGDLKHYFIAPDQSNSAATAATAEPTQDPATLGTGKEPLKPGTYWLDFGSPDLGGPTVRHAMIVATANITLKLSGKTATAWVTDLKSGLPVPNVKVTFYSEEAAPLGSATTDKNGIASIPFDSLQAASNGNGYGYNGYGYNRYDNGVGLFTVVDDGTNFAIGGSRFSDGLDPSTFNLANLYYDSSTTTVYLYSDRSLYKPGQPVYFRGVLRSRDDMTYGMSNLDTVPIEVSDASGQIIYTDDAKLTPYGTFSGKFDLGNDAPLGNYSIRVRLGENNVFSRDFSVAQYRKPEFQVNLTADQADVTQGGKVKVVVDSSFFFGGPVQNALVHWSVTTNPFYFNYTGQGVYNFTDFDEDSWNDTSNTDNNEIATGDGHTDATGKLTIEIPADLSKYTQSQTFTISADVTDASDQLVSGRTTVNVHQGDLYLGLNPEQYVSQEKKPANVDLIAVDWNSNPLPNTDISIRAVQREWHSVQQVAPDTGQTNWTWDVKEIPIDSKVVHTDANGKVVYTFTPPSSGDYKVYATTRDSHGNQVTSSAFVWVSGPDYALWRQQNSYSIDLKTDRKNYHVGDTASILITSPFQGTSTAWVTVERGGIMKSDVITMDTNSTVYKLPIEAVDAPDMFVSVMIVKGVDDHNPVAAFRMGLVQINVDPSQLQLHIDIKPDKPQSGPRETVKYAIHVTDYQGKPVQAEVGVGLTDLATLSLLPDTSTPIMDWFYSPQGLGISTSSTMTISVDAQTREILNTIKGGGGGGPEAGIFQVRQLFVDTPLWEPTVDTDANGDATVSVMLPDNLTTWRLDVRAVTMPMTDLKTTLVGQTTSDLVSTKPLLVRPLTPRFFVIGDQPILSALVNNNTGTDQKVTMKLAIKGAELTTPDSSTVTIPAGQVARVDWPVVIDDVQNVDATFYASSADNKYTDAAKSAVGNGPDDLLPVYKYEVPETVGTAGTIDKSGGNRLEGIVLPRQYNITQGQLDIRLNPSLAAVTTDTLQVLSDDTYYADWTEGVVDDFLPNLATYQALKDLKLDKPALKAQLDTQINVALQKLYNQQHSDGGWGWLVQEMSYPHVTAWALIGLAEAKKAGYPIDQAVYDRAVKYIQNNLQPLSDQADEWQLNRQAFLLYALAVAGHGDFSRSVRLFSIREKMSLYTRAYLAMDFHILDANDSTHINPLIDDLQNKAVVSATGMHWEEDYYDYWNWNTDTRTTAIIVKALVETQPDNQMIPNAVRWMMAVRNGDAWYTDQEDAWGIMALSEWMKTTGELHPNYTFGAQMNGKAITPDQTASQDTVEATTLLHVQVADMLKGDVNKLLINRTAGDGLLYYTAHLTAYLPVEQVKALSRGFTISRQYSLVGDPTKKSITQAHVGDNILVTLTIVAPSDLQYVVITDPIPAGAEAVNPNLATSPDTVGAQPNLQYNDPFNNGWGWWWFTDAQLRDEKTVFSTSWLPSGTYELTYVIRAGLAGSYHVIPTTGQETYFPEVYGRSDGALFTLLPAADKSKDPLQTTPTPVPATPAKK